MKKLICPYCGGLLSAEYNVCCGEAGHGVEVEIEPVASRRWGREFETEITCADFDVGLAEAEAMVSNIDFMASPCIVSKLRDDAGNWRFRVRSYSLD